MTAKAHREERVGRYQIMPATEVPLRALEDFYEQVFPNRAQFLKQHWRWLYRVGIYDWAPSPLVALLDNRVIGHAGVIPSILRRAHEERPATWFVDLAIRPAYQRQGLGIALTQASMAQCPIHLGFCNERSLGTLLKCGWKVDLHTRSFQLLLRPEYHPKLEKSPLTPLGRIAGFATRVVWQVRASSQPELLISPATTETLAIFSRNEPDSLLHIPRSREFLHWRILTNPRNDQHIVLRSSGNRSEEYAAIARVTEEAGFRRLHLLTMIGNHLSPRGLSNFFAGIVRWAVKEDFHRILFVTSSDRIAKIARWWFPVSSPLRFIYHANNSAGWDFVGGTEHLWECIDNDFDLT
jgi:GNAT superfamily N-acetyltransferase